MSAAYQESGVEWMGAVPRAWTVGNIRRFATMKTGHTPSRSNDEYWQDCTIPWFTLADVWQLRDGTRTYLGETAQQLSELGLANSAAELLPAGTVVLSRTASVGFSGIMPRPMATSQDFWNWICGPRLLPEFLLYQFRAMTQQFRLMVHGSTHKTIYQAIAAGMAVVVPPVDVQRMIVAYLDRETARIDELIEEQQALTVLLGRRRQALITDAVSPPGCPPLPLRRDIELLTSGSRGWAQFEADEGDRFIRIADLARGDLNVKSRDPKYVDVPEGIEGSRTQLRRDDLLFSITAYLGSVAVVRAAEVGAYVSQHVALCRLTGQRWMPEFVGWFSMGDDGQRQLNEQAYGGTKQQLALDDIRQLRVPVLSRSDQAEIVTRLKQKTGEIDLLITECRELIALLKERRAALITAAVTGQIDVRAS